MKRSFRPSYFPIDGVRLSRVLYNIYHSPLRHLLCFFALISPLGLANTNPIPPAGAATCGYDPRSYSLNTPTPYVLAGKDFQKSTPASFCLAHGLAHSASSLFLRRLLITVVHTPHAPRTLPTFAHPSSLSLPHYPASLIPPFLHVCIAYLLRSSFRSLRILCILFRVRLALAPSKMRAHLISRLCFPTRQFMLLQIMLASAAIRD